MLLRSLSQRVHLLPLRFAQISAHFSNGAMNGFGSETNTGVSLQGLPKSNVFTSSLPPDPEFETPLESHKAPRSDLGEYAVLETRFSLLLLSQKMPIDSMGRAAMY